MPPLDQARDPFAGFFDQTAKSYDSFQRHEYSHNYERRRGFWDPHYRRMRAALIDHFMHVLEIERGKKRGAMNLAIIGPGFDVMNRDFDEVVKEACLMRVRSIVVMDFSTLVVKDAVRALLQAHVPEQKIFRMQYDITNGLSTVYQRYIHEKISQVVTEDDFGQFTEECAALTVDEFDRRLVAEILKDEDRDPGVLSPAAAVLEDPLPGGLNRGRSLRLTAEGKELPLDIVSLQMVLAATGVAAEAEIWSRYEDIIASDPSRGARKPGEETDESRGRMFENIHTMIARFNTAIAGRIIHRIIEDNEQAKVLAVTDVSTQYELDYLRTGLPRLNVEDLRKRLHGAGITVRIPSSGWDLRDEPNRYRHIMSIEAKKEPGTRD